MSKSIPVEVASLTPETKCSFCPGSKCCSYVTQKIPGPRSMYDFDHLLWQVSHDNVSIHRDEEGWCIVFSTRCSFLQEDGRCGIYATRPQICCDHSNDFCEFDAPAEDGYELYFGDHASLLAYCRKRFKHWGRHRDGN